MFESFRLGEVQSLLQEFMQVQDVYALDAMCRGLYKRWPQINSKTKVKMVGEEPITVVIGQIIKDPPKPRRVWVNRPGWKAAICRKVGKFIATDRARGPLKRWWPYRWTYLKETRAWRFRNRGLMQVERWPSVPAPLEFSMEFETLGYHLEVPGMPGMRQGEDYYIRCAYSPWDDTLFVREQGRVPFYG